jgi:hypothetical protein
MKDRPDDVVAEMVRSGEAELIAEKLRPEVAHLIQATYQTHVDDQVQKRVEALQAHALEISKPLAGDVLADTALELRKSAKLTLQHEDSGHMKQYPTDLLGLERARRDCRAIMLQIVHEVSLPPWRCSPTHKIG